MADVTEVTASRVDVDKNPLVEHFASTMRSTVWVITAYGGVEQGAVERLYGGVCVSRNGYILTTSEVCVNDRLVGRSFRGESYSLKVYHSDAKSGWAIVKLRKKAMASLQKNGLADKFEHASISNGMVRAGLTIRCIGHPDKTEFCCLKGMATHKCEFNPGHLKKTYACSAHSTYLDIADVRKGTISNLENSSSTLDLSNSESCPVLTIQGIFDADGLRGSPLFDVTGLVRGLVWFGDEKLLYGIPTRTVIHGLSIIPDALKNVDFEEENVSRAEIKEEEEGAQTSKQSGRSKRGRRG